MPRSGTLLLADMHLIPGDRPQQTAALCALLQGPGREATRLVLLGDAFNCWYERSGRVVGDFSEVFQLFRQAADAGLEIHHVSGNRDFVIGSNPDDGWSGFLGERIASPASVLLQAGILPQGPVFTFTQDTQTVRCLHGDTLCTNDKHYQAFRWLVQGPIGRFLGRIMPFAITNAIVSYFQTHKRISMYLIPKTGKDIVTHAAAQELQSDATMIVCGHVHHEERRPLQIDERHGELCILPPWGACGRYGLLQNDTLEILPPPEGLSPAND